MNLVEFKEKFSINDLNALITIYSFIELLYKDMPGIFNALDYALDIYKNSIPSEKFCIIEIKDPYKIFDYLYNEVKELNMAEGTAMLIDKVKTLSINVHESEGFLECLNTLQEKCQPSIRINVEEIC